MVTRTRSSPPEHRFAAQMAVLTVLFAVTACISAEAAAANAAPGAESVQVELKTVVQAPSMLQIPYIGVHGDQFLRGLTPALGSGLEYIGANKDGSVYLYGVTDHGPSAPGPTVRLSGRADDSLLFATPAFAPSFGAIRITDGRATLLSMVPIHYGPDNPSTGLPRPEGHIPLSDTLNVLETDPRSVSPTDVAMHRNARSTLWISEAYGPSILQVGANTGKIIRRLEPGDGLPDFLSECSVESGFSGIAALPSGGLVAVTSGGCGVVGDQSACIVHLPTPWRPARAYRLDLPPDSSVTDLCPVSDTRVLALTHELRPGSAPGGAVLLIDFSTADDFAKTGLSARDARPVESRVLIDLDDFGWKSPGAGLALYTDRKTVAVISDNDFGLAAAVAGPAVSADNTPVIQPSAYTLGDSGQVAHAGRPVQSTFLLRATGERTHLWLFTLPQEVDAY